MKSVTEKKYHGTRVVFLDRDGVINQNRDDYVKDISEFIFLPNSIEAIKKLNQIGFLIVIITNQSVVNRGIISRKQLEKIHEYMIKKIESQEGKIAKIYYCPHRPDENCNCRKPKTELIMHAIQKYNVDISHSWFIGDSEKDIQAAKTVGLRSVKLQRNENLMDAINIIQKYSR